MNTTYNPQADAEQARIYRDAVTPNTPVPEAMRAMAEKVVDRSREAYDRSKDALDASVVTFERSFDAAGQGPVENVQGLPSIRRESGALCLICAAASTRPPSPLVREAWVPVGIGG